MNGFDARTAQSAHSPDPCAIYRDAAPTTSGLLDSLKTSADAFLVDKYSGVVDNLILYLICDTLGIKNGSPNFAALGLSAAREITACYLYVNGPIRPGSGRLRFTPAWTVALAPA